MLDQLKQCFTEDFTEWLGRSNNPKAQGLVSELLSNGPTFDWSKFHQLERECLQDILHILIREPKADYFWYSVQNSEVAYDNALFYHVPKDEPSPVPGDSLRVDKDKIKSLLRDIKINQVLN